MKVLMILANGFEDTEALATRDVLIRSGLDVKTVSINECLEVQTSFGMVVKADLYAEEVTTNFDAIVLPGGKRGVDNLSNSLLVTQLLKYAFENDKLVACICAAPSIPARLGYLKNTRYTCYKGFEEYYPQTYKDEPIVEDKNVITARSMYYSQDFALSIIEYLLGKEKRAIIEAQIKSL